MKRILLTILLLIFSHAASQNIYAEGKNIDKQEAIRIAQQHKPGKVLSISEINSKNGTTYRVKILSDNGDVHIIIINAETGSVISSR